MSLVKVSSKVYVYNQVFGSLSPVQVEILLGKR